MTHSELVKWALDYLNAQPQCFAFPSHSPKDRPAYRGVFDILVCWEGWFEAIEVKVGRDEIQPKQEEFAIRLAQALGVAHIVKSQEDVIDLAARRCRKTGHFKEES
jgi:hypothetical protein